MTATGIATVGFHLSGDTKIDTNTHDAENPTLHVSTLSGALHSSLYLALASGLSEADTVRVADELLEAVIGWHAAVRAEVTRKRREALVEAAVA